MSNSSWHPLQLPSLGRYYGDKCPDGMVEVTPWTTAQEEEIVRHSQNPGKSNLVDKLLSANVRYPNGFKYEELVGADQHYLLLKIRTMSLSPFYSVEYICPRCEKTVPHQHNLEELDVTSPTEETTWDEPFKVVLPKCGADVEFRHLRMKDVKSVQDYKNADSAIPRDAITFQFAKKIISVNGNSGMKFDEKRDFVKGLIMLDMEVFRDAADRKDFGFSTEVTVQCPRCSHEHVVDLPINMGFFRACRADIESAVAMVG